MSRANNFYGRNLTLLIQAAFSTSAKSIYQGKEYEYNNWTLLVSRSSCLNMNSFSPY